MTTNTVGYPKETRDVHPMLVQCWGRVADDGPTLGLLGIIPEKQDTLNQCWVTVGSASQTVVQQYRPSLFYTVVLSFLFHWFVVCWSAILAVLQFLCFIFFWFQSHKLVLANSLFRVLLFRTVAAE